VFMERKPPTGGASARGRSLKDLLPIVCSYLSGDVGSVSEGPALDHPAPCFALATADGKGTLDLARHRGKKPLVLVFGSFT
jgi:hypothetical protein